MHVQHVHTSGEVKDSHLGQEEEGGGFKPAVEFGIHFSGTCGCSAALSITGAICESGEATVLLLAVAVWKGEGDRICVHSKGTVLDLLPWSGRRCVPAGISPFPGIQDRNRAALQAALVHSVLPFILYQLTGAVGSNP